MLVLFISSYFWTDNQKCLIMDSFPIYICRCVFMSMTGKSVWIERLLAGDGTMCMYCVECCIGYMYWVI